MYGNHRPSRRGHVVLLAVVALLVTVGGLVRADASGLGTDSSGLGTDGAAPAEPSIDELPATEVVFHDGDHVVYEAKGQTATDAGGVAVHEGFTTYGDATALSSYQVRLIASDGIETYRPLVQEAVAAATAAGGPSLTVLPGTQPWGSVPGRGQIDVVVSSMSPCGGSWLGCGGPTIDHGVVVAGRIWFSPRLAAHPVDEIENTVRHELGHAVGLAHYRWSYQGRLQTMHPTSFEASGYEAGDAAGLRFLTGTTTVPVAAAAPPATVAAVPATVDPVGAIDSAVANPFGIVVRGWAVDADATGPVPVLVTVDSNPTEVSADRADAQRGPHGFAVVWLVAPGVHEVCVTARNSGQGHDVALGCRTVDVSSQSIGLVGLQTV